MASNSRLAVLVRKLNGHVALDALDQAAVLALPHVVRELKASSYIVREGEAPGHCAILLRGFAFRQKVVESGARQILSVQMPGDALDLQQLFLNTADHSIQALTDVVVAMVPRTALRSIFFERPTVGCAFAVNIQVEGSIAREWLANIGRRNARSRIAHLLCEVAVRLERHELAAEYGYELPMTQEQLGDALGLTSVHVNRMLRMLEAEGLIFRTKRIIFFPAWEKLRRVAGFNPGYLHLEQQHATG